MKYKNLKEKDDKIYYLFKIGLFYIFFDKDAEYISKITTLKIIPHGKDTVKCGFPENSLEKYLALFKRLNIQVQIVESLDVIEDKNLQTKKLVKYLNKLKELNLDNISPIEGMKILRKLKELLR